MIYTAGILVASDQAHRGVREDASGPAAKAGLEALGFRVTSVTVVPDTIDSIQSTLQDFVRAATDLVLTTGGTGFAPRDITPEATLKVIEREAEGLAEFLRRETSREFPLAVLGRGRAGVAGHTLIVNTPGSPRGVEQYIRTLAPLLPHILDLLHGTTEHEESSA